MNATPTRRRPGRRLLLAAVASGLVPLVASCSFGTSNFDAQTNQFYTPAQGVNDRTGQVDVLNALVVSDEDGTGRFIAGLANSGDTTDAALTGIQGTGAAAGVTGTVETPIDVPADGFVQLADEGVDPVLLEGDPVKAGYFVELTITFEQADEVTMKVPVVDASEAEFADVEVPSPTASPS